MILSLIWFDVDVACPITPLAYFVLDHLSVCMTHFLHSAQVCGEHKAISVCRTFDHLMGHTYDIVL